MAVLGRSVVLERAGQQLPLQALLLLRSLVVGEGVLLYDGFSTICDEIQSLWI